MIEVNVTTTNYLVTATEAVFPVTVTADNSIFTVTTVNSVFTVTSITPQVSFTTEGAGFDFATKHVGEWVSGNQYTRNDVVRYQYSIYICSVPYSNTLVSTTPPPQAPGDWELFVFNEWPRAYLTITNTLNVGSTATFTGDVRISGGVFTSTRVVTEQLSVAGLEYPRNKGLFGQVLTTNGVTTATWVNLGELVFWSLSNDLLTNGFNIVSGSNPSVPNPQLTIGSGSSGSFKSSIRFNQVPQIDSLGDIEIRGNTRFFNNVIFDDPVNFTDTAQFFRPVLFDELTTHNAGIRFLDGTVQTSAFTTGSLYTLPIASAATLGGIRVGANLVINSSTGVLSAITGTFTLPIATSDILGGIRVGEFLSINTSTGVLSVNTATLPSAYTLPIASTSTLGGIRVGQGLSINPSTGVLDFVGTSTVSSGVVSLTEPMNTNGFAIRYDAANPGSNIDINQSDINIASATVDINSYGFNFYNRLSPSSLRSVIGAGQIDSEYKIKIADLDKIQLEAPSIVVGQQSTGSVKIGTLHVNRIYNYAGTFAPFFPAGVQFQDNTVQRTAFEPDGGLIP